jgi:hypothetical protein
MVSLASHGNALPLEEIRDQDARAESARAFVFPEGVSAAYSAIIFGFVRPFRKMMSLIG